MGRRLSPRPQLMRASLGGASNMWHRLLFFIVTFAMIACYQHAPRRGALASATDSLLPRGTSLTCRIPHHGYEGGPPFRVCDAFDGRVSFHVTRRGEIVSLSQSWPEDSLGRVAASRVLEQASLSGSRPVVDSTVLFVQWRWQVAAIRTTLYRSADGTGFLLVQQVAPSSVASEAPPN